MKTVNRNESGQVWNNFWNETREEVFKVEVLQDYSGEDEGLSLAAWLSGNKKLSLQLLGEEFKDNEWAKQFAVKSIKKIRIHIVDQPYTPYLEWEFELYKRFNIPKWGEQVFVVNKGDISNLDIPDGDFWIFDNKKVIRYHYKVSKVYSADIFDEKDDIDYFLFLKEKLIKVAKPFS
jgi:hypothetical protein